MNEGNYISNIQSIVNFKIIQQEPFRIFNGRMVNTHAFTSVPNDFNGLPYPREGGMIILLFFFKMIVKNGLTFT